MSAPQKTMAELAAEYGLAPNEYQVVLDRLGREPVVLAIGQPAPQGTGVRVLELAVTPEVRTRYLGEAAQAVYLMAIRQRLRLTLVESVRLGWQLTRLWSTGRV